MPWRAAVVPEMTAVSNPNRSPPRAAMTVLRARGPVSLGVVADSGSAAKRRHCIPGSRVVARWFRQCCRGAPSAVHDQGKALETTDRSGHDAAGGEAAPTLAHSTRSAGGAEVSVRPPKAWKH